MGTFSPKVTVAQDNSIELEFMVSRTPDPEMSSSDTFSSPLLGIDAHPLKLTRRWLLEIINLGSSKPVNSSDLSSNFRHFESNRVT